MGAQDSRVVEVNEKPTHRWDKGLKAIEEPEEEPTEPADKRPGRIGRGERRAAEGLQETAGR